MARNVRIATFNCENLFSRSKVLNLNSNDDIAALLGEIAELEAILQKASYSASDKAEILRLARKLSIYVQITEDRGRLFTGTGSSRRVTADGRGDWDGGIAFRRASFKERQRQATARVIATVKADIQCLIEVEDRTTVDAFSRQLLRSAYPYNLVIDGYDPRGIDVGLMTKFSLGSIRTHIFDKAGRSRTFSRDCLEVEQVIDGDTRLHLLINHFKSQGFGKASESDAKRRRQATAVRDIVAGRFDLSKDLVVIAGDFNDSPDRPPLTLQPLLTMPGLTDVLSLQFPDPADRWTYHYRSNEQLDYILVSDALKAKFVRAGVERRGMPDLAEHTRANEVAFEGIKGTSTAASDHAAVWANFRI
jgi:predicted extracellular nuclease